MGLPLDMTKLEILRAWKDRTSGLKPIAPRRVSGGIVAENVLDGERVDLEMFPAPKWHQHDGGRYIGTADMVIMKDPDSDWVNVGTYRVCLQGKHLLSVWMLKDRDGRRIASKYWAKGKPCPVAIVLGCEPATWMCAPVKLEPGSSELEEQTARRSDDGTHVDRRLPAVQLARRLPAPEPVRRRLSREDLEEMAGDVRLSVPRRHDSNSSVRSPRRR